MGRTQLKPLPAHCRVRLVIPCRNEAKYIGRLIRSIAAADRHNIDLQVWICDGMSDDGTREIIAHEMQDCPFVRLVDNPARTTPQALNLGLKDLAYEVGIILGAHAEIDRNFLQENLKVLRERNDVGCAGGLIMNVYENSTARRIGAAMGHPFGVGNAHFRTGTAEGFVDTVAFGAYRVEVFKAIGLFDEELVRNQDDEFNFRVVKAGFGIYLSPRIRSNYFVRGNYRKLFRQYFQYGFWKVYVNRKHRTVTTIRQLVPAIFVLSLVVPIIIGIFFPFLLLLMIAVLFAYLIAATASAFRAAENMSDVPGVIFAFMILHFAYGLGYLQGLVELVLLGRSPAGRAGSMTR